MDLRAELLPPAVTLDRIAVLVTEIEQITELIFHGKRDMAAAAIAAFNANTGHTYSTIDFAEYHGWRSLHDFAEEAAWPAWPKVFDITPDELAEIVHRIRSAGPDTDYYLRLFQANVTDPNASDLIFHPPARPICGRSWSSPPTPSCVWPALWPLICAGPGSGRSPTRTG